MPDTITESQGREIISLLKSLFRETEKLNEICAINGELGPLRGIAFQLGEIKRELEYLNNK